ncbi:inositol 1,4,5-triphosphate receptor associated 1 isoform X2 [Pyxicephalus adspersus]|uniref:inositol 1,4,5-triphosphate receptor associated 1 isoform X2 n=1 Tax=Pyxicephalus adspersus TaxID=30357 RepID=UPI003B5A38CB
MPTVPGNQELGADGQHPPTSAPAREVEMGGRACIPPAIILPEPTDSIEGNCLERSRPHSPSFRSSRQSRSSSSSTSSLISVDNNGHVIDLVHDSLPDIRITEEDKKKNLELLEEAKKVSEKFLTRRGRRSRCSLSDSPTASSPSLSPKVSPVSSRSNSFTFPPAPGPDPYPSVFPSAAAILQNATKGLQHEQRKISQGRLTPRPHTLVASKETLSEQKENFDPLKHVTNTNKAGPLDVNKSSPCKSLNNPERDSGKSILKKPKDNDLPQGSQVQPPAVSNVGFIVPGSKAAPGDSKFVSRLEHESAGSRPPLLRALSWDSMDPEQKSKSSLDLPDKDLVSIHDKSNNKLAKFTGLKDFHIQPVRLQKLTKLREEHKLMRSQNLSGQKLPDLSEAAEQERGSSPVHEDGEEDGEEAKAESDVMPHIPNILLRKLRVHKGLPTSAPPLTEKEVENVFVQLSLAFRNDSYTLESRLNQAERERNLTEENNEKELENFRTAIMSSASLWQNSEHREAFQKLLEDIAVLHRLTTRLSSRAEMVGAVRQEKRMSKATEVMMQYVENLKRTYEKDHAELMEYKKLANQNSSRNYSGTEDGVPRSSRSMSLTIGKNMPRRRVSVAVVPKFNLLNIPGQSPNTSPIPALSSLSESPNGRNSLPTTPTLSPLAENARSGAEIDGCEGRAPALVPSEEISAEIKAKIEEDAYNKGFQEGLKKVQGLQEFKEEEEEKINESPTEYEEEEKEEFTKLKSSKIEECIDYVHMLYPKLLNHWSALSIVAAAIVLLAVLLSIYNAISSCTELPDGGHNKATCSVSQKFSWWTSGSPHKQRRQ